MNENIVEAIIQNEESRIRFESFCRELIEQLEGVILVRLPTTKIRRGTHDILVYHSQGGSSLIYAPKAPRRARSVGMTA